MKKIIYTISALMTLLLSQCTSNVAGSAQQGEAKVIGVIKTTDGKTVSGTEIQLLPSDFNPAKDSLDNLRAKIYNTTTDDSGKFEIGNVLNGDYVLNGQDTLLLKHIYVTDISVENEDVNLGVNILKENSFVTIYLNDSLLIDNSYIFIKGTPFYTKVDTSNIITLSTPADTISVSLFLGDIQITQDILEDIIVTEGDTLNLTGTPDVPSISGSNSVFKDSSITFRILNYSDTLAYRIDWGDSDTSQWTSDSLFSHSWSDSGTYSVKAQAQNLQNPILVSEWSSIFTITVTSNDSAFDTTNNNDSVYTPVVPFGNDTISQSTIETYSTMIWGHDNSLYEFRFDWGDTTISSWSSDTFASNSWTLIDTIPQSFLLKAQARLKTDTLKISSWSSSLEIYVTF